MKRPAYFLLFSYLLIQVKLQAQTPAFVTDSLDRYIKRNMAEGKIPGLAIAIVENGKVIVLKGYGIRQLGKPDSVDANTLFYVASNTKLFTATALANLAEEKKLNLDDKVLKYLPDFALYDTLATKMATIRDLLGHRLGVKAYEGDFVYWNSNYSLQDVMKNLRLLKPAGQFRQDYSYSNAGFVTAGLIIPKVTGQPWNSYVDQTILKPLGMTNTYLLTANYARRKNIAYGYTNCCTSGGELMEVAFDNLDNLGPAGGMISSVNDISRWLVMQVDSGRYAGKRILPYSVLEETRRPNTIISYQKHPVAPFTYDFYCLGIGLVDYQHMDVYSHTGGAFGFHTNTTFVPSRKLGIVILMNQDNSNFHEALRFQILDAYAKAPYTDRGSYFLQRTLRRDKKQNQDIKDLENRVAKNNQTPIPLAAYTGTFTNPIYGTIKVDIDPTSKAKNSLLIHFQHHPDLTARLDYMDKDEFRITFSNPRFGTAPALFTTKNGKGVSVDVKATDFVDFEPYRFSR